jgi:hypothetical protein
MVHRCGSRTRPANASVAVHYPCNESRSRAVLPMRYRAGVSRDGVF